MSQNQNKNNQGNFKIYLFKRYILNRLLILKHAGFVSIIYCANIRNVFTNPVIIDTFWEIFLLFGVQNGLILQNDPIFPHYGKVFYICFCNQLQTNLSQFPTSVPTGPETCPTGVKY